MSGEKILVDTFTARGNQEGLQYDSRSDFHSKLAGWCLVLDLLKFARHGPGGPYRLWRDIREGRLGFRLNHDLTATVMSKKLDLVICEVAKAAPRGKHFVEKGTSLNARIDDPADRAFVSDLSDEPFYEVDASHIGNARIVVEAKAAMSDLTGAMPRLYSEILASGFIARDAQVARGWKRMVMVSLSLVNTATTFRSSTRGDAKHNAAGEAQRVVEMLGNAFRVGLVTKASQGRPVFDAIGVTTIHCTNDASKPVRLDDAAKVPHHARYQQMIQDICNKY